MTVSDFQGKLLSPKPLIYSFPTFLYSSSFPSSFNLILALYHILSDFQHIQGHSQTVSASATKAEATS
ncbi:hypothetical protein V6Z11_A02G138100 [Gossypium hirsutum]